MAALPLIVGVVSALGSAAMKDRQSKFEQGQAKSAAEQQEVQVIQREADRKDRLANSLATQNALAGAKGIAAFEGSPLTILEDSIDREKVATERDIFSTQLGTLAARSGAKSRRRIQQIGSGLTLAKQGASAARAGV